VIKKLLPGLLALDSFCKSSQRLVHEVAGTPGPWLFAEPCRAGIPPVDALADQAVDASHLHVIYLVVVNDVNRCRSPDLLDLGDHLDGIWKPLAHVGG
jgi:hypothetical protein